MAKNANKQIPEFLKTQLTEAQKRFHTIENEAEHALKNLMARGRESRQELEALLQKAELTWPDGDRIKQLGKRAGEAGVQLKRRLDDIGARVIETAGVASQSQVKALNRELNRLSKKVDQLLGKKPKTSEARAE